MKVVFRADASLQIGTGHVMRCLTLAGALRERGAHCTFICRSHKGNMLDAIRESGFAAYALPPGSSGALRKVERGSTPTHAEWVGASWEEDARQTAAALDGAVNDWLVVDHYGLDARWEAVIRQYSRRIMVIDDLVDRAHDCDLLLDQNFGRTAADYGRFVPAHCRVLAGSVHMLLRPQFAARYKASSARRSATKVAHILVQMGGMDQHNYTGEALSVLQQCELPPDVRITVVLSTEAPAINAVRQQAASMKWPTTVRVGVKDMARLMEECDLAIGSGGGATYERIYMKLPSILRPTAANQIEPLRRMADAGLFELYEDAGDLARRIERVLRVGVLPPPAVVGDGTDELANELLQLSVTLRRPRALDVRRTFRWLQDDGLRAHFLMRKKPELRSHFRFWKALVLDPRQYVFSIYDGDIHVGNAGLKNVSVEDDEAELWLYLGTSGTRGKGIGKQGLNELERIIRCNLAISRAVLHVNKNNDAAYRLYLREGYVQAVADPHVIATFGNSDVIKMEKHL